MSDTEMATSTKKKKSKKEKKDAPATESTASETVAMETDEPTSSATEIEPSIAAIASPLANKKLAKKCLKLVKKAAAIKSLRRGVKEVVKAIRKGEKGSDKITTNNRNIMFIAGNITPIDVISHLPVLCETSGIPYVYVPSKEELGIAGSTKRPTSCILVQLKDKAAEHKEAYDEVAAEIKKISIATE